MIELLIVPFILCVALVLIHVYFGSFVLKRGVIFIDLALAQWAALGYLIGHWAGVPSGLTLFVFAWGFTVIAAFILSFLKPIYQDLNLQEAVIGVLYIGAAAIAIGLISLTGMEGHHLSHMLAGHLLFVQPVELYASLGVYALIGVMLLWLHRYFLNENSRGSEFVFCVLFGLVVTSSVQLVGILLVFSYLVIPLLIVMLHASSFKSRLLTAWGVGILSSVGGMMASMVLDIPPSYAIILVLMLVWVGSILLRLAKRTDA